MKVAWKPFQSTSVDGNIIIMPGHIDDDMTLLNRMLNMPDGKVVSYVEAENLFWEEFNACINGLLTPVLEFQFENIVDWAIKRGYKIVPTKNDYEILPSTESA